VDVALCANYAAGRLQIYSFYLELREKLSDWVAGYLRKDNIVRELTLEYLD